MSKHNSKDTTLNASLDYITALVCDPTEVGDLVKAAREHATIGQIDIALAWYQKAEHLLPHLQSAIFREWEGILQRKKKC
jgi:hypothetical protein